jgi:hypothetical protein
MHRFEGRGLIERSCKTKSNQPNRTKRCRQHFAHFLGFAKFKYAAQMAVTPFGGMASFFAFLERIEPPAKLQQNMPFVHRSPNSLPPAHTLTAFLYSVVVGASRFAHSDWLRSDKALHAMLGITRFPGTDTIRNFFARFTQGTIEAFWRPLWSSILEFANNSLNLHRPRPTRRRVFMTNGNASLEASSLKGVGEPHCELVK